jgi:hypothetical protein
MTEKDVNITPRFEILTPTGWSAFDGIKSSVKKETLKLITDTGRKLNCTLDHKIKTNNGFVEVRNLIPGDIIETITGLEKIKALQLNNSGSKVFDILEVANQNQYYTNGIVSHNCAWLGSSGTLISGAVLKSLVARIPLVARDGLKVYEEKQGNHQYVIVCDVSRGKGLDYSAFQVIDITQMPYNQVCTYKNNMVTPLDYAGTIFQVSKLYNSASILVEINDTGGQVADALYFDYECESVIQTENAGARGKRISAGFSKTATSDRGVRTTKTVKSIGCSMLKLLIEQRQLIINDYDTIFELSRFSRKGTSYEAESGCHDDLVMGLVLFGWMSDQQYFKDLTDINTLMKLRDRTDEELERDLLPTGFKEDGHPEDEIIDLVQNPNPEFMFF